MWSLGILVGLPISILLIAVLGFLVFVAWAFEFSDSFGVTGWGMARCILTPLLVLLLVGTATGFYPYKAEYHRWETTSGAVDAVSSRLLGGDGSMTQRFVVRFADGRERSCDDTRCSLLKPGDHLTLSCKRTWQYAGRDGWDCNYLGRKS